MTNTRPRGLRIWYNGFFKTEGCFTEYLQGLELFFRLVTNRLTCKQLYIVTYVMHFMMILFNLHPSVSEGRLKGEGEGRGATSWAMAQNQKPEYLAFPSGGKKLLVGGGGILVYMYLFTVQFLPKHEL